MHMKAILFDLDGTLLASETESQISAYMKRLVAYAQRNLPLYAATMAQDISAAVEQLMGDTCPDTSVADKFWACYCARTGAARQEIESALDTFYRTEYGEVGAGYTPVPQILEAVALCKTRGYQLAVATNSFYPLAAVEWRIRWAGLNPADFACITHYGNMCFTKSNPAYYLETAALLGVPPQECAMVGNDGYFDMIAGEVGMRTFLLTNYLENGEEYCGPRGDYHALLDWLGALPFAPADGRKQQEHQHIDYDDACAGRRRKQI